MTLSLSPSLKFMYGLEIQSGQIVGTPSRYQHSNRIPRPPCLEDTNSLSQTWLLDLVWSCRLQASDTHYLELIIRSNTHSLTWDRCVTFLDTMTEKDNVLNLLLRSASYATKLQLVTSPRRQMLTRGPLARAGFCLTMWRSDSRLVRRIHTVFKLEKYGRFLTRGTHSFKTMSLLTAPRQQTRYFLLTARKQ